MSGIWSAYQLALRDFAKSLLHKGILEKLVLANYVGWIRRIMSVGFAESCRLRVTNYVGWIRRIMSVEIDELCRLDLLNYVGCD